MAMEPDPDSHQSMAYRNSFRNYMTCIRCDFLGSMGWPVQLLTEMHKWQQF